MNNENEPVLSSCWRSLDGLSENQWLMLNLPEDKIYQLNAIKFASTSNFNALRIYTANERQLVGADYSSVDIGSVSKSLCFDNAIQNIDFSSVNVAPCIAEARALIFENPIAGEYLEICHLDHFSVGA